MQGNQSLLAEDPLLTQVCPFVAANFVPVVSGAVVCLIGGIVLKKHRGIGTNKITCVRWSNNLPPTV